MTFDLSHPSDRALRIIVGWDKTSPEGLRFAAWLARSLPVSVSLTATAPRSWTKSLSRKKYEKWLSSETDKLTAGSLTALKEHLPRESWAEEPCTLIDAQAPSALAAEGRRVGADIIILNSSATMKQARFLASSIADELMHSSPLPLGLAPKGLKLSKKGVTRVNFVFLRAERDQDTSGLVCAARLAAHLQVPLRLISVLPEMPSDVELDSVIGAAAEATDWYESSLSLLDLARDQAFEIAAAADPATAAEFEVETSLANGKGWEKAVSSVKWKKGDLICLGSHPTAQGRSVLVGSRASEFLRYAPAPVVIFPRLDA